MATSIAEQIILIAGLAHTPVINVSHLLVSVQNKAITVGTKRLTLYTISKAHCLVVTDVQLNSVPVDPAGIPVYASYKHNYPWGGASQMYWDMGTTATANFLTPPTNSWLQMTGEQFLVFAPGLPLRLTISRDFTSGAEPTTVLMDCRVSGFLLPAVAYNTLRLYSTNNNYATGL